MRSLGVFIEPLRRPAVRKHGEAMAGLIGHWPAIVGAAHASATEPGKLSFPRGARIDGTLTIKADGPTRLVLSHDTPRLIERINGYFGFSAVARLRFVDLPAAGDARPPTRRSTEDRTVPDVAPPAEWTERIARVADPELAESLRRLAGRVAAGRKIRRSTDRDQEISAG